MGSFEWMELQSLTSEIAAARSRLAAARSSTNPRHIGTLEEEVAAAEARRVQLISHITTNLADTREPAPGVQATDGADAPRGSAPVAENGAASPAGAPKPSSVAGGLVVWDRLTPGDIARATSELGVRRTQALARHVAELTVLDADRSQLESLERAIDAFVRHRARLARKGDNVGDIATHGDDPGLRLQAHG